VFNTFFNTKNLGSGRIDPHFIYIFLNLVEEIYTIQHKVLHLILIYWLIIYIKLRGTTGSTSQHLAWGRYGYWEKGVERAVFTDATGFSLGRVFYRDYGLKHTGHFGVGFVLFWGSGFGRDKWLKI
jgi:hypothetical protein